MDGKARKPVLPPSQHHKHSNSTIPSPLRQTNPQTPRSSSSTTPYGFSFTDISQATQPTEDSGDSNGPNENAEEPQRLRVYQNTPHGERKLIISKYVRFKSLQRHSAHFASQAVPEIIDGERCLVVHVEVRDQSNITAIYTMIDSIDESPVPRLSTDHGADSGMSFEEFLKLSIVLWAYICRVTHWADVALSFKDRHWVFDLRNWTADRLVQWLFISLVFDWPDVFEAASGALIVRVSRLEEEFSRTEYLPPELLGIMWQKRQDYMQQSYNFLRNIWMELKRDPRRCRMPLADAIDNNLSRDPMNFELYKDLPPDLHKFLSPGKILEQVKQSIGNERPNDRQTHDPQADVPRHANSDHSSSSRSRPNRPGAEHMRGSLAAEAAREIWSSTRAILSNHKNRRSTRPAVGVEPVMTVGEVADACDDLLDRIDEFQREKLRPLDIHDFDALRKQHILTP